ncbi:UDP-glycosyltransferase 79B9-like, partial [Capsicum annuum]|uniref:UDP-glycosyltransferase 79B9-like n=1 Tax=Capsicum annuum TaxID=4072 RepID=UPI001FB0FD66
SFDRVTTSLARCDAIAIRTCRELEGPFCDYLSSQYNKHVLLTGPILPEPTLKDRLDGKWANWLQQYSLRSVTYCAFGTRSDVIAIRTCREIEGPFCDYLSSQYNKQPEVRHILCFGEFQELILGIESTNLPFLIALRAPLGVKTIEEALLKTFEERTKGKGIVCRDFVPQIGILSHTSIWCFVSHKGGSTLIENRRPS